MAFISCRCRLTKVLAGAARGKKGTKGGGDRVRLSHVDTGRLLEYRLICHLKLVADMVGVGIREFVNEYIVVFYVDYINIKGKPGEAK